MLCEEKRIVIKIPLKESKLIEKFFTSCDRPIHALNSKLLIVDTFTWFVSMVSFLVALWIGTELIEILINHETVKQYIEKMNDLSPSLMVEELALIWMLLSIIVVYSVFIKLADISHLIYHKIHKITAESIIKDYGTGVVRMVLSTKKPTSGLEDVEACLLAIDLLEILKWQKENLEKEGVFVSDIIKELEKDI